MSDLGLAIASAGEQKSRFLKAVSRAIGRYSGAQSLFCLLVHCFDPACGDTREHQQRLRKALALRFPQASSVSCQSSPSSLACIFVVKAGCSYTRRTIRQRATQVLDEYSRDGGPGFGICVSDVHPTTGRTEKIHDELEGCLVYMAFFEKAASVIAFEDIGRLQKHVSFPQNMRNDLRESILKADADRARAIINAVLAHNRMCMTLTVETSIYLFMMLLSELRSVAFDSPADEKYLNRHRTAEKLLACRTFREMLSLLCTLALEICLYVKGKRLRKHALLSERVADHVRENFGDAAMDINSLGRHFRLTPAYLSRKFSSQSGKDLHDFIITVRIERARDLMRADVKIMDVARMAGFGSVNSFIRAFRQKAGMTPGEYRSLM